MKASELRERSVTQLQAELRDLYKEQFNFRMSKGMGRLSKVHRLGELRRDIARVKTVMTEKQRDGDGHREADALQPELESTS